MFDKIKRGLNTAKVNITDKLRETGVLPLLQPYAPPVQKNQLNSTTVPTPTRIATQIKPDMARNIQPKVMVTPSPTPTPTPTPQVVSQDLIARNPNLSKFTISPEVETSIRTQAKQYNIKPEILGDVALQESSFNPKLTAKMGGYEDSTAQGLFMFNDPSWQTVNNYARMKGSSLRLPSQDRLDPNTSSAAAAYLIANGQLGRWYPSASVWAPHYTWEELQPFLSQTTDPEALKIIKYYAKK